MSDYALEEALADARGWVEGTTFHKGQRGWKPALAVILDEFDCVTKDHADCDEFAAALMKERDELAARLAEAEWDAARGLLQAWESQRDAAYAANTALAAERDRLMRLWADAVSDAEIARSEADQAGMRLAEAKRLLERWHQQYQEPQTEPGDAIDDDTTTFLGLTDNETAKE